MQEFFCAKLPWIVNEGKWADEDPANTYASPRLRSGNHLPNRVDRLRASTSLREFFLCVPGDILAFQGATRVIC